MAENDLDGWPDLTARVGDRCQLTGDGVFCATEAFLREGPADLDVAHCCTNLALPHGPGWGLRFAEAYEEAGGVLAAAPSERRYWRVRDALAASEEVSLVSKPWREAGRTELTTRTVKERLDAYVTTLMSAPT